MKREEIYDCAFAYFRSRRRSLVEREFSMNKIKTILDLGGTPDFWRTWETDASITCLNLNDGGEINDKKMKITCEFGDACHTSYQDDSYDLCFSNSVIEHVGDWEAQSNFAREVRRLSPSYWVQTPNKWFFVEPHFVGLFIHWLPAGRIQWFCCRYLTMWGIENKPDRKSVSEFADSIRLLGVKQMQVLFPDARIIRERFLGMTKSIIALRVD